MKRRWAILLGVLTSWPPVYFVMFIAMMMVNTVYFNLIEDPFEYYARRWMLPFEVLFLLHMLTMLLIFVLIAIYLVHLFRTHEIPQDKKALWAVVLFLGNVFAMPVYWYIYIRPRDATPPAPS